MGVGTLLCFVAKHKILLTSRPGDVTRTWIGQSTMNICPIPHQTQKIKYNPREMREVWVSGNAKYFGINVLELLHGVRVCHQFSWTHISEIEWVEKQNYIFSLKVWKWHLSEGLTLKRIYIWKLRSEISWLDVSICCPEDWSKQPNCKTFKHF